jgi:ADP-glucose pyrophosphorylase
MEKYLAALAFVSLPTFAQEVITVSIDAYCITKQHMAEILAEHQEKPMLVGVSIRNVNNKESSFPMVIFVNSETNSFTIAEKVNDYYCVTSMGEKIKPFERN